MKRVKRVNKLLLIILFSPFLLRSKVDYLLVSPVSIKSGHMKRIQNTALIKIKKTERVK